MSKHMSDQEDFSSGNPTKEEISRQTLREVLEDIKERQAEEWREQRSRLLQTRREEKAKKEQKKQSDLLHKRRESASIRKDSLKAMHEQVKVQMESAAKSLSEALRAVSASAFPLGSGEAREAHRLRRDLQNALGFLSKAGRSTYSRLNIDADYSVDSE